MYITNKGVNLHPASPIDPNLPYTNQGDIMRTIVFKPVRTLSYTLVGVKGNNGLRV